MRGRGKVLRWKKETSKMEKTKAKADYTMDDPKEVMHFALNEDGPTKTKLLKLNDKEVEINVVPLTFNPCYQEVQLTQLLAKRWAEETTSDDYKDDVTGVQLYNDPFQICLIPNFLNDKAKCRALVDEMVEKVVWSRKQMDLYEFYQSADLSNMIHCKLLTNFLQMLRRIVRPWLEKVTNLQLDYVSASCSMYTCGDYLLVHDDLLKDRQVAFVFYLSPWEGAEQWQESQGGCLEIFNADEQCFPHFPVKRQISPLNNQFAFFKVGSRSFHQVQEVTTYEYPRLTINGWFHGASNEEEISDTLRPITKLSFQPPCSTPDFDLSTWINSYYLQQNIRASIQKRIEDNSETCLYEFLNNELFKQATVQLLMDETLSWSRQGPANAQNYEILDIKTANKTVESLIGLFSSQTMFELLHDYTDLDLAGLDAKSPSCSLELQRWTHGNYTVLGDGALCEENTLDVIYYLNADKGAGIVTYLSPEDDDDARQSNGNNADAYNSNGSDSDDDDSILLTITPIDNAFNMVYRCEGTTKFTKYVSHNTPLEKGPVFILTCSYKE